MEVYAHPLYAFHYDPDAKVLSFVWTFRTEDMGIHDYREALHNFAGFAGEYRCWGLLVDVREFRFHPTPELGAWRDEVISPRYVKAGVRRFAYVAPPDLLEKVKGRERDVRRGFDEEYFESQSEALKWLVG